MKKTLLLLSLLTSSLASAEVTRHALPNNSTFPIARAVEVTPDTTLIFHSGMIPSAANPDAEQGSAEYYGDTETQALSVLKRLEESYKDLGVGFEDVVKMQVCLVGDPNKGGEMDFAGFMSAYTKYFGTEEQANLPARSAFQIAGLAGGPYMLVEVETVLARPVTDK